MMNKFLVNNKLFTLLLKNRMLILIVLVLIVLLYLQSSNNLDKSINKLSNNTDRNKDGIIIENKMVSKKYNKLVDILGKPNYIEFDGKHLLNSATWMSPLNNFNDFGKYGGCDYIKIHGYPSKKYHPYPAKVFLIVGKYISVPEHLFGPLKYASETINIEQLFIPKKYIDKYYDTGIKELALVTGSCASVTISVVTVQFAIDMIQKYKDTTNKCLELYEEFRNEYDRRIDDYLCGRGITNSIPWFDPDFFEEPTIYNIGEEKCNKNKNLNRNKFTDCPGPNCREEVEEQES